MTRRQPIERRSEGVPQRVVTPLAPLLDGHGNRQRELLFGAAFRILARETERAWGFAAADGYLGWIENDALGELPAPTHRVAASRTYAKATPKLKVTEPVANLSLGSLLHVTEIENGWAKAAHPLLSIYVPAQHLAPVELPEPDPVSVAERFLGTPYLWGGNSAFGIDCSGLVQAACVACGIECPGDSDMQAAELGRPLPADAPLQRGDLVFWEGHVAMLADDGMLIHANAHHMAVAHEPLADAVSRITAQGDGPVTARRRP